MNNAWKQDTSGIKEARKYPLGMKKIRDMKVGDYACQVELYVGYFIKTNITDEFNNPLLADINTGLGLYCEPGKLYFPYYKKGTEKND